MRRGCLNTKEGLRKGGGSLVADIWLACAPLSVALRAAILCLCGVISTNSSLDSETSLGVIFFETVANLRTTDVPKYLG
jgi:hypothetical protein